MNNIKMYTSQFCPYCSNAESLLKSKGYEISEKIYVDQDPEVLSKMIEMTGKRTVPQIFINDKYIVVCWGEALRSVNSCTCSACPLEL